VARRNGSVGSGPQAALARVKAAIVATVRPAPALSGETITGGVLDLTAALNLLGQAVSSGGHG
jgi:hypothetical protein